jgi:hypothetical protein
MLARRYGLATDIVDAMMGQKRKSVADMYGSYPVDALHREVCKIPPLLLD